jgi:ADP-heptose:LPS heptosyltransferase
MEYYFEFGGGLGDVFLRIFCEGEYRAIERLKPEDRARISLITVNSFADELFEWHAKRDQLDVTLYPHWQPDEDRQKRTQYNLPPKSKVCHPPHNDEPVEFYPAPSDLEILDELKDRTYFVLAASAGLESRIFPDSIVAMICREAANLHLDIVAVGRNYPRGESRYEPEIPPGDHSIDLIDQLSVPGTAKLIEGAAGVICSHSALCHLAWFRSKPVLLLYPEQVYEEHIAAPRNGYTRGLDRPTTRHALFDHCTPRLVRGFLTMAVAAGKEDKARAILQPAG